MNKNYKIGIAIKTANKMPINGERSSGKDDFSGWMIWGGDECPSEIDAFAPYCINHIPKEFAIINKYLHLSVGYRFQIDNNGYEDVWFDERLK